MSFLRSMPHASLIEVFLQYPELARPLHELAQRLLRGPSPFSAGERELLAAYVSRLNHCAFCEASHTAVATLYGYERTLIEQLAEDLERAAVPERFKPVFRYVRKLTLAPSQVNRADVEALYEAGWDETAVTHAALVCAYFNFMNRWVDGLGIEASPTMVKTAAEMLHKNGYGAVIELLDLARPRNRPAEP